MRIEHIDSVRHRIPRSTRADMRADVVFYANADILAHIEKDRALEQSVNVACMPGLVGPSLAMPDIHQGYGFPIGGVAAMDFQHGVVSPGGVGYDINCGVRLARTRLEQCEVRPRLKQLLDQVFRDVPCGVGGKGHIDITEPQLKQVLRQGAGWMMRQWIWRGFRCRTLRRKRLSRRLRIRRAFRSAHWNAGAAPTRHTRQRQPLS